MVREASLGEPLPLNKEFVNTALLEAVGPLVCESVRDPKNVSVPKAVALVLGERDPEGDSLALAEGL